MKNLLVGCLIGIFISGIWYVKNVIKIMQRQEQEKFKQNVILDILGKWFWMERHGKKIENWFIDKGYSRVAVYGMGVLGKTLVNELADSLQIVVVFGVDRAVNRFKNIKIVNDIEKIGQDYDVMVVTPVLEYKNILAQIKSEQPIISIEQIIKETGNR